MIDSFDCLHGLALSYLAGYDSTSLLGQLDRVGKPVEPNHGKTWIIYFNLLNRLLDLWDILMPV